MSCSGPFTYYLADTLIESSQSVTCQGSVTIPGYTTPGTTICYWDKISCGTWKKTGDCKTEWTDCYYYNGIELWPSIYVDGSATVNTTLGASEIITFTTEGPSASVTTTLTINSVVLTLSVSGITESFTIADTIVCYANSSGQFSATIALLPISGSNSGVSWSVDTDLLLCPTPSEGDAWLNLSCSFTVSEEGYSSTATMTLPITEA